METELFTNCQRPKGGVFFGLLENGDNPWQRGKGDHENADNCIQRGQANAENAENWRKQVRSADLRDWEGSPKPLIHCQLT